MAKAVRFLLVDDDADDTSLFKEVLEEVNPAVQLDSAEDGHEALNHLKEDKDGDLPDVIFLDLNMPRMGGKECLTEIKRDERLQDIPVIMYTTSSQSKDIEETIQKGAICFITKPTNMGDLRDILSSISTNVHNNLERALRFLSDNTSTFIVC